MSTKLEAAARQALEALKDARTFTGAWPAGAKAITALREALAEQAAEPGRFVVVDRRTTPSGRHSHTVESDWPLPIGAILHTHPAPTHQPLPPEVYITIAHRIASRYSHRTDPTHIAYTFLPNTLEQFVRAIEDAIIRSKA